MRNKFLLFMGVIQFFFGSYGMESSDGGIDAIRADRASNIERYIANEAPHIPAADSAILADFLTDTVRDMIAPLPTILMLNLILITKMGDLRPYPSFNAGGFKLEFTPRMDIWYDWGAPTGNCYVSLLLLSTAIAKTPDPTGVMAQLRADTKAFFAGKAIRPPLRDDSGFFEWVQEMRRVDAHNEQLFRTALESAGLPDMSKFSSNPPFVREVFAFKVGELTRSSSPFLRGFLNANLFVPRTDNIEVPSSVSVTPSGFLGVNILDDMEEDVLGTISLLPLYERLLAQLIVNIQEGVPSGKVSDLYKVVYPLSGAERHGFNRLMNLRKGLWEKILNPKITPQDVFKHVYFLRGDISEDNIERGFRSIREYLQTHPVDPDNTVSFILSVDKLFKRLEVFNKVAAAREYAARKKEIADDLTRRLTDAVIDFRESDADDQPSAPSAPAVQAGGATQEQDDSSFIEYKGRMKRVLGIDGYDFKVECFIVNDYRDGDPDPLLVEQRLISHDRVKRWVSQDPKKITDIFVTDPEYQLIKDDFKKALLVIRHGFCPGVDKLVNSHGQFRIDPASGRRQLLIPGIMRVTPLFGERTPIVEHGVFQYSYGLDGVLIHRFFNIKTPDELRKIIESAKQ